MLEPTSFTLKPFKATLETEEIALTGTILRTDNTLSLRYLLSGNLDKVRIPQPNPTPQRRDRLWEQTCLEYFLHPTNPSTSHYWEINLSPCGDWNIFALSGYRTGLQEELAIAHLPFQIHQTPDRLQLDLTMDIAPLSGTQDIQIGISAVLIFGDRESHWAIAHPATQADFHHPKSFALHFPSR